MKTQLESFRSRKIRILVSSTPEILTKEPVAPNLRRLIIFDSPSKLTPEDIPDFEAYKKLARISFEASERVSIVSMIEDAS